MRFRTSTADKRFNVVQAFSLRCRTDIRQNRRHVLASKQLKPCVDYSREVGNARRMDSLGHARVVVHSARGSSASRKRSPMRLNAATVRKTATPGKTTSHHAYSMYSSAEERMLPHVAVGTETPKPR